MPPPAVCRAISYGAAVRIVFLQKGLGDESLALADVAAILQRGGHEVSLRIEEAERRLLRSLRRDDPDLLVIQASLHTQRWLREMAAALRFVAPIVLVGTGVTFDPELLPSVDVLGALLGEIDRSLPELVRRLEVGEPLRDLPAWAWIDAEHREHRNPWGPLPDDLDATPLPLRELYFDRYAPLARLTMKRFSTGRGCLHSCGFCYQPLLRRGHGAAPAVRRKSVGRVIAEVRAVAARWPLRRVLFSDDLFAADPAWMAELAERFGPEVGLPFACQTSPETISDAVARDLARAGAVVVGVGLESGDEARRADALGRPTPGPVIEQAVRRLQRRGVAVLTYNILGSPGEDLDAALRTLAFNQRLGVDFPRVTRAFATPGSVLDEGLRAQGRPRPDVDAGRQSWAVDPEVERELEVLVRVFRAATLAQVPVPLVRALCRHTPPALWKPLGLVDAALEWRWSGLGPTEPLRWLLAGGGREPGATLHTSMP